MNKTYAFTCLLLLFWLPGLLFGQVDKSRYRLLWEISGNGLGRPSYLFGTMHVQDERAFEFSDSILPALDAAEAFAMEINPNRLVSYLVDLSFNGDTTNVLRQMFGPEEYGRIDSLIIKATGSPIDSLDVKDPMLLESLLSDFQEPDHTEKREWFLDLYLFRLAYQQGKSLLGLERPEDYRKLNRQFFQNLGSNGQQEDPEQEALYFEQLLSIYRTGDLDAIDRYLLENSSDEDYEFELLTRRNRNMARVLEGQMRRQSVFCAVGVAHLPGKQGIIELLRQKGYRLRAVSPVFSGQAAAYVEKKNSRNWFSFESKSLGYGAAVPEAPSPINFSTLSGDLEGHLYSNLFSGQTFLLMAAPEISKEALEQPLEDWAYSLTQELLAQIDPEPASRPRPIQRNGVKGFEIRIRDKEAEGNSVRWQVFRRDKSAFLFGVLQEKTDMPGEDLQEADRFFESIRLFEPQPTRWTTQVSAAGAFVVAFPSPPVYSSIQEPYAEEDAHRFYVVHQLISRDPSTGATFGAYYFDQPSGIKLHDTRQLLDDNLEEFKRQWGEPLAVRFDTIEGYPAYIARFQKGNTLVHLRLIQRGNRQYRLFTQAPLQVAVEGFFKSFALREKEIMPLDLPARPKGNFQVRVPGPWFVERVENTREDYPQIREQTLYAQDTLSGASYLVNEYEYSPYFRMEDPDGLFETLRQRIRELPGFQLLRDTTFQGRPAVYSVDQEVQAPIRSYRLLFLEGHFLYELVVQQPENTGNWPLLWSFFESFQSLKPFPGNYLQLEKKAMIFEDLQSADTVLVNRAKREMDHYRFDTSDLPLIYSLLRRDFPADTSGEYSIHDLLFRELLYTNDAGVLSFLESLFALPERARPVLYALAGLKTRESWELLFRLAPRFQPMEAGEETYTAVLQPLADTLSLAAQFIPQLGGLLQHPALRLSALRVLIQVARADSLDKRTLRSLATDLLAEARRLSAELESWEKAGKDSQSFPSYWTLDAINIILGELGKPGEVLKYLVEKQNYRDLRLLLTIVDDLLMQDQPVKRESFDRLFENSALWYQLLENVQYEEKLDRLPIDLFTPEHTVRAYVDVHFREEFQAPLAEFEVVEVQPYTFQGESYLLYWFAFTLAGYEGEAYLGLASQPPGKNEVAVFPELFDYSETAVNESNWRAVQREILEGLEKN